MWPNFMLDQGGGGVWCQLKPHILVATWNPLPLLVFPVVSQAN